MTEPDLDTRRRIAEKLGIKFRHVREQVGTVTHGDGTPEPVWVEGDYLVDDAGEFIYGMIYPGHTSRLPLPPWDLSMDACLRDLVPWAWERGYPAWELSDGLNGSYCRFAGKRACPEYRRADTPTRAFCAAWLELPEKESEP